RKIVDEFATVFVVDRGSDGHAQDEILAADAGPVRTFTVASAIGLVFGIETEVDERVVLFARFEDHIAAVSAVAAPRPSARDELLPAESDDSIAAVPAP